MYIIVRWEDLDYRSREQMKLCPYILSLGNYFHKITYTYEDDNFNSDIELSRGWKHSDADTN